MRCSITRLAVDPPENNKKSQFLTGKLRIYRAKWFPVPEGLRNAVAFKFSVDTGRLAENLASLNSNAEDMIHGTGRAKEKWILF